jgi:subtilisin family serine protease
VDVLIQLDRLGVVIVVAAGNFPGVPIYEIPAVFASPTDPNIPTYHDVAGRRRLQQNMMVVGGSAEDGNYFFATQQADYVATYAPAEKIYSPKDPSIDQAKGYKRDQGTSFGKFVPQLARPCRQLAGFQPTSRPILARIISRFDGGQGELS